MTRTTPTAPTNRSIRTFLIFCTIVVILITIALIVRFVSVVQHSVFSKKSQFNLMVIKNDSFREIYSFNPINHSLSLLKVKGKAKKHVEMILGIPLDAKINFPSLDENKDVENLTSLLFHYSQKDTTVTYFDVMQMAWYGYTLSKDQLQTEDISLPATYDDVFEQNMIELFGDNQIKNDDQTIQIINATGVSGVGSQLEWVLSHIGGHIVAVSTSQENLKNSTLTYIGDKTYTVSRIEKLLTIPATESFEKGISDIIIVIGEDRKNMSFLH